MFHLQGCTAVQWVALGSVSYPFIRKRSWTTGRPPPGSSGFQVARRSTVFLTASSMFTINQVQVSRIKQRPVPLFDDLFVLGFLIYLRSLLLLEYESPLLAICLVMALLAHLLQGFPSPQRPRSEILGVVLHGFKGSILLRSATADGPTANGPNPDCAIHKQKVTSSKWNPKVMRGGGHK